MQRRSFEGQHVEWPSSEGLLPFSVYAALKRIASPFSELYITTPFLFLFFFLFQPTDKLDLLLMGSGH